MSTKTMNVAIYAGRHGNEMIYETGTWMDEHEEYVRLTESREITFQELPRGDVLRARVRVLDRIIADVKAEAQKEVEGLQEERQRLLAITHQPEDD